MPLRKYILGEITIAKRRDGEDHAVQGADVGTGGREAPLGARDGDGAKGSWAAQEVAEINPVGKVREHRPGA